MVNKQVKISFDTNCWDKEHFRLFIKSLQNGDKANFIFYIITEETDVDYVNSVAIQSDVESSNIVYVTSDVTKLTNIYRYSINFHFDSNGRNVDFINNDNITGLMTKPIGFLVNWLQDTYNLDMLYIKKFRFQLSRLLEV